MKLIIAGSRTINPSVDLINGIISTFGLMEGVKEIVSGMANGVDSAGERWCIQMQILCGRESIGLKLFKADWETHGKAAGPIRNKQMADYADSLLLIWDGTSRGSKNMKETMQKLGKPVYEVILKKS